MPPEEYYGILQDLELREIYLERCSTRIDREVFLGESNIKVQVRDKADFKILDDGFSVRHKYDIKIVPGDETLGTALTISATFCANFSHPDKIDNLKEFFTVFSDVNLPLNTWPYFRELAQSMTQRANVPPLTLPFIKRR